MIKFQCSHCSQKLGVPQEYAGKRVRCSKCQQVSVVPAPADVAGIELERSPQPPPPPAPETDDLERNGAIRDAARGRDRGAIVPPPIPRDSAARGGAAAEVAKGMGKIPLSLGFSVLLMSLCIILWVFVGRITGMEIGFLVLLVPTAGAWGLTYFTDNRGVMMALLAVFIGFAGMVGGKVAVAKWVIYPILQEKISQKDSEFTQGFREGLEGIGQLTPEDVEWMIEDDEVMVYIAALDVPLERQTVKAMYLLDEETPDYEVAPEVVHGFEKAYEKLDIWDAQQKESCLRKHYTVFNEISSECDTELLINSDVGKAVTGIIAFIAAFGFLDLIWFPMGLYGAWKIGAGTAD